MAKEHLPHIILMDINMPGMDGIAATEAVLQAVPATQVIMLSVQGESDYLRRAMMAGARDFLTKPPNGDELMSTIRRVYESGKGRVVAAAPAPAAGPAIVQPQRQPTAARRGDVVAIYSPKGGVGCTTVAINVSIALQQLIGSVRKIGLMDADLQFGDVSVMLNMHASRSMVDLVDHLHELDDDLLSSVLTTHGSGIRALLAPPHPEAAESLMLPAGPEEGGAFELILGQMRHSFDIIVTDMASRVDDTALTIFDAARMIVLVVNPNIPSIKSTRAFIEVLQKLDYPTEGIALAINCMNRRGDIRAEQIAQALSVEVVAQIPFDDQAALAAANRGAPFIVSDQARPISMGIMELARHIRGALVGEEGLEGAGEDEEVETMVTGTARLRLGRLFR
jgi:pilus assembly protein CpaE